MKYRDTLWHARIWFRNHFAMPVKSQRQKSLDDVWRSISRHFAQIILAWRFGKRLSRIRAPTSPKAAVELQKVGVRLSSRAMFLSLSLFFLFSFPFLTLTKVDWLENKLKDHECRSAMLWKSLQAAIPSSCSVISLFFFFSFSFTFYSISLESNPCPIGLIFCEMINVYT